MRPSSSARILHDVVWLTVRVNSKSFFETLPWFLISMHGLLTGLILVEERVDGGGAT